MKLACGDVYRGLSQFLIDVGRPTSLGGTIAWVRVEKMS